MSGSPSSPPLQMNDTPGRSTFAQLIRDTPLGRACSLRIQRRSALENTPLGYHVRSRTIGEESGKLTRDPGRALP